MFIYSYICNIYKLDIYLYFFIISIFALICRYICVYINVYISVSISKSRLMSRVMRLIFHLVLCLVMSSYIFMTSSSVSKPLLERFLRWRLWRSSLDPRW